MPTTDVDATEKAAPASSVEYSAGVVRLGNIKPAAPEVEDATPDITGKGEDLDKKSFADFGVTDPIVDALEDKGITHPFPIQALTLGPALERHDIIGQAKTGTGKTLGFGIPVLEDVIAPDEEGYEDLLNPNKPQALIILPTRELTNRSPRTCARPPSTCRPASLRSTAASPSSPRSRLSSVAPTSS